MYAGKEYGFDIEGYEHFAALDTSEEGFMIYSSHVGNYEVAGYSLVSEHKRYNALVYGGESPTVMENRRRMFAGGNINMIVVSDGVSHLYGINNALADGEIVSMPCDRLFGSQKVVGATLLGAPVASDGTFCRGRAAWCADACSVCDEVRAQALPHTHHPGGRDGCLCRCEAPGTDGTPCGIICRRTRRDIAPLPTPVVQLL
jgi:hypothetical protein